MYISRLIQFPRPFEAEVEKFRSLLIENAKTNTTFASNPLNQNTFTYGEYQNWTSPSAKFTWKEYLAN